MLGDAARAEAVGESNYFWEAGYGGNLLCACGMPIRDCPYWVAVVSRVRSQLADTPLENFSAIEAAVARRRKLLLIAFPSLRSPGFAGAFDQYAHLARAFYGAIGASNDAKLVIDSSKDPVFALLLHKLGLRLRVVHLVRDVRGVAYSRLRKKPRADQPKGAVFMPRQSVIRTALKWTAVNLLCESLASAGIPYCRVRYEDLVESPAANIEILLQHAGKSERSPDQVTASTPTPRPSHIALGNPGRMDATSLQRLKLDEAWREKLARANRTLLLLITWPLMLRYGYFQRDS